MLEYPAPAAWTPYERPTAQPVFCETFDKHQSRDPVLCLFKPPCLMVEWPRLRLQRVRPVTRDAVSPLFWARSIISAELQSNRLAL